MQNEILSMKEILGKGSDRVTKTWRALGIITNSDGGLQIEFVDANFILPN